MITRIAENGAPYVVTLLDSIFGSDMGGLVFILGVSAVVILVVNIINWVEKRKDDK